MPCCKKHLEFIMDGWDNGYGLDIRIFRKDKLIKSEIFDYSEIKGNLDKLCDIEKLDITVFVGVLPRKKSKRGSYCGSDDCIADGSLVWFDHDFHNKDIPSVEEEKNYLLKKLGTLPSLLIFTGRGYHGYLRLSKKVSPSKIKEINKYIASLIDSDSNVANPSRVMRLCGSLNEKVNKRADIVYYNPTLVFDPNELLPKDDKDDIEVKEPAKNINMVLQDIDIPSIINTVKKYYEPGHRNRIIMSLLGDFVKNGVPFQIAYDIVSKIAENDEEKKHRLYLVDYHYNKRKGINFLGFSGLVDEFQKVLVEKNTAINKTEAYQLAFNDAMEIHKRIVKKEIITIEDKIFIPKLVKEIIQFMMENYYFIIPVIEGRAINLYYYDGTYYKSGEEYAKIILYSIFSHYKLDEHHVSYYTLSKEFEKQIDAFKRPKEFARGYLSFKNGILNVKKLVEDDEIEIIEHTPDLLVRNYIDYEIDKSVFECKEDIIECFRNILPDLYDIFSSWSDPLTLLEVIGYTLLVDMYPLNKIIMLLGEGSNGKSTYLSIISDMLGPENVSFLSLQEIAEKDFARENLYSKMANIFADLPKKSLRNSGIIKALVGEDRITANRKHKSYISFFNYAKMIFSANQLPQTEDLSDAYWRRWVIVNFPNKFEPDPQFKLKLQNALDFSKLIPLSLLAIKKAIEKRKFNIESTNEDIKEQWMKETDTVYGFLSDAFNNYLLKEDKNGSIKLSELYEMYADWYKQNVDSTSSDILSEKWFAEKLVQRGYTKKRTRNGVYLFGLTKNLGIEGSGLSMNEGGEKHE